MKNVLLLFLLLSIILPSFGQDYGSIERITRFHSDIQVDTTGRVSVTEHISVYASGYEIQRGIKRWIPIYRKDNNLAKQFVDIKILEVLRDGVVEPYHTERKDGNLIVYVGSSDVFLTPGNYDYSITYESYGHVGFFEEFDELYWNVTGNDWDFLIEEASASIQLPAGVDAINTACYTGISGSASSDCSVSNEGNRIVFSANNLLLARNGLTVAVSFPRDIIKRPPPPTGWELLWYKYKGLIVALIGLFLTGLFYYRTWRKVGKDPEKPVVIPMFRPPHGWSPAVVRYLYKRKCDNVVFSACLVGMAVKKLINIKNEDGDYTLSQTKNFEKEMNDEEAQVYKALLGSKKTIKVSKNNSKFHSTFTKLERYLDLHWDIKKYFLKNIKHIVWGTMIAIAVTVVYASFADTTVWLVLCALLFAMPGFFALVAAFRLPLGCATVFLSVWGLGFSAIGLLILSHAISFEKDWVTPVFVLLMIVGYVLYVYLIKAPTQEGAEVQAELEGFKMYLETAEEKRLNMLTVPERTPELFEELLPYAIALDVENKWSKKFSEVLKRAGYAPEWYQSDTPFALHSFSSSINSFTSSVGSAQTTASSSSGSSGSSSWSSGSSGGGSSGGGGGGGGGGGW